MKSKSTTLLIGLALLSTLNPQLSICFAQDTAFTYQGRLTENGAPANGSNDFAFTLFDAASGGAQQGSLVTRLAISVSNGLFTVSLDFGNQFPGANRWLEIGVRTNGGGAFATLSPRQPITAAPYTIKAREAATVPAGTITGAMLADGAVSSAKLQSGAALQNILASGSASVAPGGVVMSDDPTNATLNAQGYVRMPNAELTLAAEKWTQLNPPATKAEFIPMQNRELSVNTGSEMIIFRFGHVEGFASLKLLETIRYNPTTGQWSKGATPPLGIVDEGATTVWTGSQVILWGGEEHSRDDWYGNNYIEDVYANKTGVLAYSPASDQWSVIAGTGAIPEGRRLHSAIWTGSRMLVWGGEKVVKREQWFDGVVVDDWYVREDLNTGASFDPATGAWTALSTNAAPNKRRGHAAVWTGSRMVVQGGTKDNRENYVGEYSFSLYSSNVFYNGFSYNPANDTWAPIRSDSTAPRQAFSKAVWTGSEMFIFGGVDVTYVTVYED